MFSNKLPKLSGDHVLRLRKPCCMPMLFFPKLQSITRSISVITSFSDSSAVANGQVCVYWFIQKYFNKGVMIGAAKE